MNNLSYKKDNFKLENFIKKYKEDLNLNLVNFNGKKEKPYNISVEKNLILEINEDLSELNEGLEIYLPITTAVYDDMKIINGDEVDLNEGLEAEYVEGFSYMPTSGRMIDIGEVEVSTESRVALLLNINKDEINIALLQGKVDKNLNLIGFKKILNAGIVSIEIVKYLEQFINC